MTAKELAALIDGREAGSEFTADEERQAEESGLVALYVTNADTAVLNGAIKDKADAIIYAPFYVARDGFVDAAKCNCSEGSRCPFCRVALMNMEPVGRSVRMIGNPFCSFEMGIPHEKFRTFCGPEVYCEGIVFRLEDLPGGMA